jgi:hypothetical protein
MFFYEKEVKLLAEKAQCDFRFSAAGLVVNIVKQDNLLFSGRKHVHSQFVTAIPYCGIK